MDIEIFWDDLKESAQKELIEQGFVVDENINVAPLAILMAPEKKTYRIGVREVYEQMYEVEASSKEEALKLITDGEGFLDDHFEFVEISKEEPYSFYGVPTKTGWSAKLDPETVE